MPRKWCQLCGDEYFARWRNTPAICEACALAVVICPGCWKVKVKTDPLQLALFSADTMARRGVWPSMTVLLANHFANTVPRNFDWESYTESLLTQRPAEHVDLEETPPWPRRTSAAERRRYPLH